jgi:Protein of unknown function (DUF2510)
MPAGWYPDHTGQSRYWDGTAWTEQTTAPQVPSAMPATPQATFTPRHGPKKPRPGWLLPVGIGLAGLVLGLIIGLVSAGGSAKTAAAPAPVTVHETATKTLEAASAPAPAAKTITITAAPSPTPAATPPAAGEKTVLHLAGNGDKTTANFTVTEDQWTIAYVYSCANVGGSGNFIVDVNDSTGTDDFNKDGVNELGATGNSSTVEHGSGTYSLSILSECTWTITVKG